MAVRKLTIAESRSLPGFVRMVECDECGTAIDAISPFWLAEHEAGRLYNDERIVCWRCGEKAVDTTVHADVGHFESESQPDKKGGE